MMSILIAIILLFQNLGIPLSLSTTIQVNVAVRMNAGNPTVKPLKDKIMPIAWLALVIIFLKYLIMLELFVEWTVISSVHL